MHDTKFFDPTLVEAITLKRRLRSPYLELRNRQHRRERRSVSTEKNVEMLMVADKTMYEFYKDGLEEYLLTIANMVCNHQLTLQSNF